MILIEFIKPLYVDMYLKFNLIFEKFTTDCYFYFYFFYKHDSLGRNYITIILATLRHTILELLNLFNVSNR